MTARKKLSPEERIARVKAGLAARRAAGGKLGRPWAEDAPRPARVRALRAKGKSWPEVAEAVGSTIASARRAAGRDE